MKKKIYAASEHTLPIDKVDRHALFVMEKLTSEGHTAYLVGGSVRDLLLGRKPKDFDISTSAQPDEVRRIFRNCILIGRRFRLAHIRFGKKILEVATFRAGDPESDEIIVRDNIWGSPEEDALRRDFTINGLFYDPATQSIIDYVGGFDDIKKNYLRTIGQPHLRFKQDPVRMIRMLKFQARFGFEGDPDVRIALLESRHEILKSSQARILEELLKMLESGASKTFFHLMTLHGFTQLLLPLLGEFLDTEEGEEIYDYLDEIDSHFKEPREDTLDRPVLLACLLYPILERRIKTRYSDRERAPHLGEIQNETTSLINETFHPFFHISRRLRMALTLVLSSQLRFTPTEKKKRYRIRIPRDPDFALALKFFKIRTQLEPALNQMWDEWNQAFMENPPRPAPPPRRRRPRRRRR